MHKVVIICQVPAETPYEAEDLMREYVKPFRQLVEKLFISNREQKPTGWFGALKQQLFGW
jgi:hypothetical protein